MKLRSLLAVLAVVATASVVIPVEAKSSKPVRASYVPKWPWVKVWRADKAPNPYWVKSAQLLLRNRGFSKVKADGKFGSQTGWAVKQFQKSHGLKADGIVGPQTWSKLVTTVKRGSRGDAVRVVQLMVGTNLKMDGVFGYETETQVRLFQRNFNARYTEGEPYGLKVDGIVGPDTWNSILADLGD